MDRDGQPDYWPSHVQHDACGNLLRSEKDYKGDGAIDLIHSYDYDCDGAYGVLVADAGTG